MNVLLTSVGRRGYLVNYFKEVVGSNGLIWGCDYNKYAPALQYCDKSVLFPKVDDPQYVENLLSFCKNNDINIIVPLIDPELEVFAAKRHLFDEAGIMNLVSTAETIELAYDKYLTYKFGVKYGIAVPETFIDIDAAIDRINSKKLTWPVVVKPRKGSASAKISYCFNKAELRLAFNTCPMPMVQEYLEGDEYGYDIFSDREFRPISVYCKKKLVMRAGETDRAVSINDSEMIDFGLKIANNLKLFGPLDADVKLTKDGPKLLEINPRFGGGYPCAHLGGADFPAKIISIFNGEKLTPDIGKCPPGVYMMKQDEILTFKKDALYSIQKPEEWQIERKGQSFTIRLLESEDELLLKDFFTSLADSIKRWYSPHAFDERTAEEICSNPDPAFQRVLIIHEGRIIGYCVLYLGLRKWEAKRYRGMFTRQEVSTIAPCVVDEFQHHGLGTAMMNYVKYVSKFYGRKAILLWGGVVVKNIKAVNFYKRLGFETSRKWLHPQKRVMSYDMYWNI